MVNVVDYDATAHNVRAVTVFQVDRAEVNRRIEVKLKAGQNEVAVSHLPSCLDQDSIRVDGLGAATIFDVIYIPPSPTNRSEHNDKLQQLYKQRADLAAERNVLEREIEILDQYAGSLNAKDANAGQLGDFLVFYAEKKTALNRSLAVLDEKTNALDKEIRAEQTTSQADLESEKRGVKVTIIVLAEDDGAAELSLSYTVTAASWTPLYDLRASIAGESSSGKGEASSVLLHYRASISQRTGEAWDGVQLTLSTASPQLGTDIPTVRPLQVSEYSPPVFYSTRSRKRVSLLAAGPGAYMRQAPQTEEMMMMDSEQPLARGAPLPALAALPAPVRMRETTVGEGAVSATFLIEGLSTIPSDTDDDFQTHKVSIAEIILSNIDLEWVTVPKEIPTVYLQCKVKNTSNYPFLPGPASVYMGNSFVAKSSIPNVSPQEHFFTSLGVDNAVRVTYHPQQKKTKQPTGSLFASSKTSTTSFAQRISIKNTRRAAVPRLVVRDGVPNSTDARIKVNVVEPKELPTGGPTSAGGVVVKEGIRARWAQKNDDKPIDGDTGDGRLEWICSIPAGGDVDLNLAWEVSAPAGVQWRLS
ncbi:hypothetical protein AURDEDRAFT_113507, partial [Auricularia subglabra TFB-10046 SS5]